MALPVRRRDTAPQPVQRWDPFREIQDAPGAARATDAEQRRRTGTALPFVPAVDIEETEDAWIVEAELPGVKPEDVNVEVRGTELAISGEIKEREREGILRRRTRKTGEFDYHITLPGRGERRPDRGEAPRWGPHRADRQARAGAAAPDLRQGGLAQWPHPRSSRVRTAAGRTACRWSSAARRAAATAMTPLPWIVDADAQDFDGALDADVPVLVDFWAAWCAPCRMVGPIVERLGKELAGRLKVVRLDVDGAPEVAARHGAQSIPLLVLFRGGEEVDRQVGAVPERQLRQWLEPHLTAAGSARET